MTFNKELQSIINNSGIYQMMKQLSTKLLEARGQLAATEQMTWRYIKLLAIKSRELGVLEQQVIDINESFRKDGKK